MSKKSLHPSRWRLAGLAAGVLGAVLLVGQRAVPATDCVTFTADLTLVEVSEDGVPLVDRAAYQNVEVGIWGRAPGEVEVIGHGRPYSTPFFAESYRAPATPGR